VKRRPERSGPVADAVAAAQPWFRAAAVGNALAAFGMVTVLYAVASLVSANLHRVAGKTDIRWLVVGLVGLAVQLGMGLVASRCAAHGAAITEEEFRRRSVRIIFAPGAPLVDSAVVSRLLIEGARDVADASERWEPLRLQVALIPAVLVAFALATNWLVGCLLLVAAPLIPLNMAVFGMGAERLSSRQAAQVASLDQLVVDRIKGGETLVALRAAGRERVRVRQAADELAGRTLSVLKVALLSSAALEALVTYAVAVVATYIGLVLLGYVHIGWAPTTLSLRSGLFLLLLAPAFFQPFRDLAAAYHDRKDVEAVADTLEKALAGAATVASIEAGDQAPEVGPELEQTGPSTTEPASGAKNPPAVRVDSVGLQYRGSEDPVLEDISFVVPRGAMAGVAGPSGIGKTTLLRLITGRMAPSSGSIEVSSEGVAWVSQRPYFFQTSIQENLLVACPRAGQARLWDALESVGLAELVAGIPDGLRTRVGWSGAALSGGQARRLALARALLSDAELLVLDEPTAHLDPETESHLLDTIADLVPERTVIVASHAEAVLARCSRVLVLGGPVAARFADVP